MITIDVSGLKLTPKVKSDWPNEAPPEHLIQLKGVLKLISSLSKIDLIKIGNK
ncbi:MAG: hypothetical protein MHPSP_003130, partial [Paramarteilia canceri]